MALNNSDHLNGSCDYLSRAIIDRIFAVALPFVESELPNLLKIAPTEFETMFLLWIDPVNTKFRGPAPAVHTYTENSIFLRPHLTLLHTPTVAWCLSIGTTSKTTFPGLF